jgi:hypothetical protein
MTAFVQLLSGGASLQLLVGHKVVHQSAVWPTCPQTEFELWQLLQGEMAMVAFGGSGARLELILLTGDAPQEPPWCESLALQAGCDCEWADPVKALRHDHQSPSPAPVTRASAGLMTACGLALRRFKDLC